MAKSSNILNRLTILFLFVLLFWDKLHWEKCCCFCIILALRSGVWSKWCLLNLLVSREVKLTWVISASILASVPDICGSSMASSLGVYTFLFLSWLYHFCAHGNFLQRWIPHRPAPLTILQVLGWRLSSKHGFPNFLDGPVVKNLSGNAREHQLDPWSGKIPSPTEQLSPSTTATEPMHSRAHAPPEEQPLNEKPTHWSPTCRN